MKSENEMYMQGYQQGIKLGLDFACREFMNPISYLPSDEFDRLVNNAVDCLYKKLNGDWE